MRAPRLMLRPAAHLAAQRLALSPAAHLDWHCARRPGSAAMAPSRGKANSAATDEEASSAADEENPKWRRNGAIVRRSVATDASRKPLVPQTPREPARRRCEPPLLAHAPQTPPEHLSKMAPRLRREIRRIADADSASRITHILDIQVKNRVIRDAETQRLVLPRSCHILFLNEDYFHLHDCVRSKRIFMLSVERSGSDALFRPNRSTFSPSYAISD